MHAIEILSHAGDLLCVGYLFEPSEAEGLVKTYFTEQTECSEDDVSLDENVILVRGVPLGRVRLLEA